MLWLQSIVLRMRDPAAGARFLSEALSFAAEQTRDGSWLLESGSNSLLLQEGDGPASEVIVVCKDVASESSALLAFDGVTATGPVVHGFHRVERRLHCDFGLEIRLIKDLDEDERQELLPLPASLEWDERADGIVRRILRIVPLGFRAKARERVTHAAELVAVEEGELCVGERHALRGLARATLPAQYDILAEAMRAEGVDPTPYVTTSDAAREP